MGAGARFAAADLATISPPGVSTSVVIPPPGSVRWIR